MSASGRERWANAEAYESFIGRWSRLAAREFIAWLDRPAAGAWLDVGSGTGALSRAVLELAAPRRVKGIDPSDVFVVHARRQTGDERVSFEVGDAQHLDEVSGGFDTVVAGLSLNFVPLPEKALGEMARVTKPGGCVGAYVWDYAEGMQMLRYFWDAAGSLDPAAGSLDEGSRFPLCQPDALRRLLLGAGLEKVETRAIEITTHFANFEDYWTPFMGGQGPGPGYVASLSARQRVALRERLRERLPVGGNGAIRLNARVWAVRGWVAEGRHSVI